MFGRAFLAALLAIPLLGAAQSEVGTEVPTSHPWAESCERWDEWDKPGPAFKVYGNTYYVGTCGIAAILITSDEGHVLIDSGTEAGAEVVLANIRSLGFDPADVKLLLNSHEHFDHVGGMAKMQEATGAEIVSSSIGVSVMLSGVAHPDDPQYGMHDPMRPVAKALPYSQGNAQFLLKQFNMWPIFTPGHSPGAMSWKWRSCEGGECRTVVYADSLSAVSRDDYRFSDHPAFLRRFLVSLDRIDFQQPCEILLTPHPSASNMREKLSGDYPGLSSRLSCSRYARAQRVRLFERIEKEDPELFESLVQRQQVR